MAPSNGYEIKATTTPAGLKKRQTNSTTDSQPKRTASHLLSDPQCLKPACGTLDTIPKGKRVAPKRPKDHSQSPSVPEHCDQINNNPPQYKAANGAGIPLKPI